jgi:ABC-type transporter Mla MlaB component
VSVPLEQRTTVLAIGGPIDPADVAALCRLARGCLERSGANVLVCDVSWAALDAVTVEALARLALTARRLGCGVRLQGPSRELGGLLAFIGLDQLLRVEPGRQAEQWEEAVGVEEGVEPDDPAA